MPDTICFVSLISKDNSPLYIQPFTYDITDKTTDATAPPPAAAAAAAAAASLPTAESDPLPPPTAAEANDILKYSFLSHMSLDIFESPFIDSLTADNNNLLFVQDGISVYGFETNTGLKVVLGTETKDNISEKLYPVFRQIHKMYLKIVCNPFSQAKDPNQPIENERFDSDLKKLIETFNSA